MKSNKLKAKLVENGVTMEAYAKALGIDTATLYRRINKDDMRIRDAIISKDFLKLSNEEAVDIFLN